MHESMSEGMAGRKEARRRRGGGDVEEEEEEEESAARRGKGIWPTMSCH
jgi:hypothetical protein